MIDGKLYGQVPSAFAIHAAVTPEDALGDLPERTRGSDYITRPIAYAGPGRTSYQRMLRGTRTNVRMHGWEREPNTNQCDESLTRE